MATTYFQLGISHILDLNGYDHMLFVAILLSGVSSSNWKAILSLITTFTIAHSITLGLTVAGYKLFSTDWVEFLIPITIMITALGNLLKKAHQLSVKLFLTGIFGLVHGLGFANYLSSLLPKEQPVWKPLLFFNLGVEAGQIVFALAFLGLMMLLSKLFKSSELYHQKIISILGIIISLFLAINNWPV
ncbi:MAG: HupE/UreJ family protein [Salibacteraceae bacterium]